jgi:hypothetical protein
MALVAYKVFSDGHEELVRNVALEGLSTVSFKDIVAVSTTSTACSTTLYASGNSSYQILPFPNAPAAMPYTLPAIYARSAYRTAGVALLRTRSESERAKDRAGYLRTQ